MTNQTTETGQRFVTWALETEVIGFRPEGFPLKSGRGSPYFFNIGIASCSPDLAYLGKQFTDLICKDNGPKIDVVYGSAYKGIPLATAIAVHCHYDACYQKGVRIAYDRKEVKNHGEGGRLVGASFRDANVAIVDDVITDGATKRKAVELIRAEGGTVARIVVAFDRCEPVSPDDRRTATEALSEETGVPVLALANVYDLRAVLGMTSDHDKLSALNMYFNSL